MPALPSVPKVVRVALNGLIDGTKPWVNLFHIGYSVGATVTAADVLAMANAISSEWGTQLQPALADTIRLSEVIATSLESSTAPMATDSTVRVGANAVDAVAAGTAMVIQRKVGRRYRGGHSRVYLAGMPDSYLDDTETQWDATIGASIQAGWDLIEGAGSGALVSSGHTDAGPVNVSYFEGFTNVLYPSGRYHVKPTVRATPVVDKVIDYLLNPRPCSQRRRQQP